MTIIADDPTKLLELARHITVSAEKREAQRRNFASGNATIKNERITRQPIDDDAAKLAGDTRS